MSWLTGIHHTGGHLSTNVHLVDIDVFTKSDEIPSLPVQVIKEKPNFMDYGGQ